METTNEINLELQSAAYSYPQLLEMSLRKRRVEARLCLTGFLPLPFVHPCFMRPQTGCTATKNPRDSTTPLGMLPRTKLALDIFEGELDLRTRSLLFLQLRPDSCGFCRGGGVGSRANP